MQTYQAISNYLSTLPEGEPFRANVLYPMASSGNARQILSRLVKAKELERLSRGVFLRPKKVEAEEERAYPSLVEIVRNRVPQETISIHGAEAARLLLLTTQMPLQSIFYTSGHTRTLTIGRRTVYLKHAGFYQMQSANTIEGIVIAALSYIGKKQLTSKSIYQIKSRLSYENFQKVLEATPRMPRWIADLFYQYKKNNKLNDS